MMFCHQPRSTHGETHGSSGTCSRRWPCQASMGGKALGPVKARWMPQCRGIQGSGWVGEHPHRSRGMGYGIRGFWRGNWKGVYKLLFETEINKITNKTFKK